MISRNSDVAHQHPLAWGPWIATSATALGRSLSQRLAELWVTLALVTRYVVADARRHRRNGAVAVATVCLVVAFVTLLQNAVGLSPVVFLRLSEAQVGEYDLVLTPQPTADETAPPHPRWQAGGGDDGGSATMAWDPRRPLTNPALLPPGLADIMANLSSSATAGAATATGSAVAGAGSGGVVNVTATPLPAGSGLGATVAGLLDGTTLTGTPLLNSTDVAWRLRDEPLVSGVAARWTVLGRLANRDEPSRNASAMLLVVDSEHEAEIGLGRAWHHRPLGEAECHVSASLLRQIGVVPDRGQRVVYSVSVGPLQDAFRAWQRTELPAVLHSGITVSLGRQPVRVNVTLPPGFDPDDPEVTLPAVPGGLFGPGGVLNATRLLEQLGVQNVPPEVAQLLQQLIDSGEALNGTLPTGGSTIHLPNITSMLPPGVELPPVDTGGTVEVDVPLADLVPPATLDILSDQVYKVVLPILDDRLAALDDGVQVELRVVDAVDSPGGKWPTSLGSVVLMEKRFLPQLVSSQLPRDDNDVLANSILGALYGFRPDGSPERSLADVRADIEGVHIDDYALLVSVQFRDRMTSYLQLKAGLDRDVIRFTNAVAEALGIDYPAALSSPLVSALDAVYYIRLFLDQIFYGSVTILIILGVMLIYSLLLSDVEEKTYEYGMLRALGLRQDSLISLLLVQSMLYAVPGILLGLIVAALGNAAVATIIAGYTESAPDYSLSGTAVAEGVMLGLIMPILANLVPIRRALSRTLRDALDIYHQAINETTVQFVRLEDIGLSPWQVALSLVMVIVGFTVYYVVPWTFVYANIALFLTILNVILLGMVLGLATVATSMQPYIERATAHVMLGWPGCPDRPLAGLVQKALGAHRSRNRKTALMFTLSLAFVIFAGTMFVLQANSIVDNVRVSIGSDIAFLVPRRLAAADKSWEARLDERQMRPVVQAMKDDPEARVRDFSFGTHRLWLQQDVRAVGLNTLAGEEQWGVGVHGLDRSYLSTVFNECV